MPELPDQFFQRQDESPDEAFYEQARLVTHIDDATISSLTAFYEAVIPVDTRILDLMSSWISHLPAGASYRRIAGLGMNAEELKANPALQEWRVQNLNEQPALPWDDTAFDAVLIAVSVQYLTRPFEVFAEIARVLEPGGQCIVAMSHRLFPTKAIQAFRMLSPNDRCRLVASYMDHAGLDGIEALDQSPADADPLWIVRGRKPEAA
ncbi:MAG: methyltransferase domain-containing protein [Pseudomonadota bacterium]